MNGVFRWSSVRRAEHDITIGSTRWSERVLPAAGLGLGTVAFAQLLKHYNASWAPWPDAYVFYFAIVIAGLRQWVVKARDKQESIVSGTPLKEVTV